MVGTDQPMLNAAERRRRGHAEARRHERGLSGDRLGHGGAAPRADQAAGGGRLEPVLHRLLRPRFVHARRATCRCAATARAPGSAGPTIRRSRSCGRRGSTPRTCAAQKKIGAEMQLQAFENVPFYPLGLAQTADRVPQGHHRRAGGVRDLLERAPHLIAGSARPQARSSSSSARRCAGRPAQQHVAPAGRVGRRVRRAFLRTAVRADRRRRPIRTVGGIGDGGNAGSARRAAGAHPAGGNRHRHAVLGARGRGTAADAIAAPVFVATSLYHQPRCLLVLRLLGVPRAPCRPCCRPRRTGGAAAIGGCASAAIPYDAMAALFQRWRGRSDPR